MGFWVYLVCSDLFSECILVLFVVYVVLMFGIFLMLSIEEMSIKCFELCWLNMFSVVLICMSVVIRLVLMVVLFVYSLFEFSWVFLLILVLMIIWLMLLILLLSLVNILGICLWLLMFSFVIVILMLGYCCDSLVFSLVS